MPQVLATKKNDFGFYALRTAPVRFCAMSDSKYRIKNQVDFPHLSSSYIYIHIYTPGVLYIELYVYVLVRRDIKL